MKCSCAAIAEHQRRLEDLAQRRLAIQKAIEAQGKRGLEPLAQRIMEQPRQGDPLREARRFVAPDRGVEDAQAALAGARDIAGRTIGRKEPATPVGEAPMPPERVRRWLEGLDVEGRDLDDYDQMIDQQHGASDDEE